MTNVIHSLKQKALKLIYFLVIALTALSGLVPFSVSAQMLPAEGDIAGIGLQTSQPVGDIAPAPQAGVLPADIAADNTVDLQPIASDPIPEPGLPTGDSGLQAITPPSATTESVTSGTGGEPPSHTSFLFKPQEPVKFEIGGQGTANVVESTGAFYYSYPLAVLPGRSGLQPELTLAYSSQDGQQDSIFGYGWDLSVPSVQRDTSRGNEALYTSNNFVLNFAGAGKLVPISVDAYGFGTYGAGIERSFAKIEYLSTDVWRVTDKLGRIYTFGATAAERQDDPADASRVFKWMISETRDTNDNFVRYEYFKDSGQIYPKSIFYTGYGSTDGLFRVNFEPFVSGSLVPRPDVMTSYGTGFRVETKYAVSRVNMLMNGGLKKFYQLNFVTGSNGQRQALHSVTAGGLNASQQEVTLPATEFSYAPAQKTWNEETAINIPRRFEVYSDYFRVAPGSETKNFQILDVNGDSLADIVYSFDTFYSAPDRRTYLNDGANGWVETTDYQSPFIFIYFDERSSKYYDYYKTFRIMDVNGDNLPDFVESYRERPSNGAYVKNVYLNNGVNGWDLATGWNVPLMFAVFYNGYDSDIVSDYNPGIQTADVNGDGREDFIQWYKYTDGSGVPPFRNIYLNNGVNGWDLAPQYTDLNLYFAEYNTDDRVVSDRNIYVRIFDVNGDGLDDVVRSDNNQLSGTNINEVYLNNGKTGWTLDPAWRVPFDFAALSILSYLNDFGPRFKILDVNGDGLQDFVYHWRHYGPDDIRRKEVYINNGKNGWTLDPEWVLPFDEFAANQYGDPDSDFNSRIRFFDATGNGLAGYVTAYKQLDTNETTKKVYRTPGVRSADRLSGVSVNGRQALSVGYDMSALGRVAGSLANPKLPANVLVAKSVTYDDGLGATMAASYDYTDGAWYVDSADSRQNRFAGFGKVERALGNTKTTTYFHQGGGFDGAGLGENSDSYAKIGQAYRSETRDVSSGALLSQQLIKWDETSLGVGRKFVFKGQESATDFTGSAKSQATRFTYDFANGNTLTEEQLGLVNLNTATGEIASDIAGDEKNVTHGYAQNVAKHILSAPKLGGLAAGAESRLENVYYDQLPLGQVDKVNPTKEEFRPNSVDIERTFNSFGLAVTEADPRQNTTSLVYDGDNLYPATTTNPLSQASYSVYEPLNGRMKRQTDANGLVTEQEFDAFGRPTVKRVSDPTDPGALTLAQEVIYDDNAFPAFTETHSYFNPGQYATAREYFDALGRSIQKKTQTATAGQYATVDSAYDSAGRTARVSLPYITASLNYSAFDLGQPATSYTYDALGRVLTETNILGTTTYAYDGWSVTVTDPESKQKLLTRDAYGNIAEVQEHNNAATYTTTYVYNVSNKLKTITDSQSNVRNFVYDDLDRLTSQDMVHRPGTTNPAQQTYQYDAAGNVIQTTNFNGWNITYTYDALNRVLTESANGVTKATYTYDQGLYGKGHLTSAVYDNGDSVSYVYDILGRLKTQTSVIKGTSYALNYQYNLAGEISRVTYPGGNYVAYDFNSAGQVSRVTLNRGAGPEILADNLQYNVLGKLVHIERSNGIATDYTYDPAKLYRLTHITSVAPSGTLQDISYQYTLSGNIQVLTDIGTSGLAKTATYGYDDLYRLTSASVVYTQHPESNYTQTFGYDSLGNLTSDSALGALVYGTSQPHQLSLAGTQSITYDFAGNVMGFNGQAFRWNFKNQMYESQIGNRTTSYRYDQNGQRYSKVLAETTTSGGGGHQQPGSGPRKCPIDQDDCSGGGSAITTTLSDERYLDKYLEIAVISPTSTATSTHLFLGSQKLGTIKGNNLFFAISDHLGSPSVITTATGTVAETRDFKPFGAQALEAVSQASGLDYRFTGKEKDEESGLQYFGARYLNNGLSRFVSIDPVVLALHDDGKLQGLTGRKLAGLVSDPQALNSYAYSRNNPIILVDNDGNFFDIIFDVGFIAYDAYRISKSLVQTGRVDKSEFTALGLDFGGAILPGVTGLGLMGRVVAKGDDVADAAKSIQKTIKGIDLAQSAAAIKAGDSIAGLTVTKHAAEKFAERGMKVEQVDTAITRGIKYLDTETDNVLHIVGERGKGGYTMVTDRAQKVLVSTEDFVRNLVPSNNPGRFKRLIQ